MSGGPVEVDVLLDALALVEAHYRHDEEAFDAVLDATGGCPWYLAQLVDALAELSAVVLEGHPEGSVDRLLAGLHQLVLGRL